MKVTCTIGGMKDLGGTVERTIVRVRKEWRSVALSETEALMADSLNEVPRDTEALANSAFIEQDANGDVDFGYGGDNAQTNPKTGESSEDYMVEVHERLDLYHPVGKAKFLEDPVNRSKVRMSERIAARMKRALREGK